MNMKMNLLIKLDSASKGMKIAKPSSGSGWHADRVSESLSHKRLARSHCVCFDALLTPSDLLNFWIPDGSAAEGATACAARSCDGALRLGDSRNKERVAAWRRAQPNRVARRGAEKCCTRHCPKTKTLLRPKCICVRSLEQGIPEIPVQAITKINGIHTINFY